MTMNIHFSKSQILLLYIAIARIFLTTYSCENTDDDADEDCEEFYLTIIDKSTQEQHSTKQENSEYEEGNLKHDDDENDKQQKEELELAIRYLQMDEFMVLSTNAIQSNKFIMHNPTIYDIANYISNKYAQDLEKRKVKKYTRNVDCVCFGDIMAIYIANKLPDEIQVTIDKINKVGANAVIVNVKDDLGRITIDQSESNNKSLMCRSIIKNMKQKIAKLKQNGFYTIARIVTYKDTSLIINPEYYNMYIMDKRIPDGECPQKKDIWCDKEKTYWLNPFSNNVTQYLLSIIREACLIGYDEIHLDYVRFSTYLSKTIEAYNNPEGKTREQAVTEFIKQAKELVDSYGKKLSVAIFGIIPIEAYMHINETILCPQNNNQEENNNTNNKYMATSKTIGQDYDSICKVADYICPMLYPSHFPYEYFGIPAPDKDPYQTVCKALMMAEFAKKYRGHKAEIRPYLQCFTASWLKKDSYMLYDGKTLNQQIKACCDNDIYSFYLFNNAGDYKVFYM